MKQWCSLQGDWATKVGYGQFKQFQEVFFNTLEVLFNFYNLISISVIFFMKIEFKPIDYSYVKEKHVYFETTCVLG